MKRPIEGVIEEVVIAPDKIQPIIVNFQNGVLKDEEAKKMKCGLYRDEPSNKDILAMSNGKIVYKGERPDLNKELTYTMLAIHNKKTGKIRLIQAERWNIAPVLDQHVDLGVKEEDMLFELNTKFAVKKVKRRTEQHQKMKVDVNAIKDDYQQRASNVEINPLSLEAESKDDTTDGVQLPPCNTQADTVAEVYNINDIVPEKVLKTLFDLANEVAEGDLTGKSQFFVQCVEYVKTDPDRTYKIAVLLYMEAISKWLNTPTKGSKKDFLDDYTTEISSHILNTYSVPSAHGRLRPNTMKDKGIIHCIILGLMIRNYILDLELLSTLFKFRLGIKKLQELARVIRALPHKDDKKCVMLKLPLPAELPKIMPKRKKSSRA